MTGVSAIADTTWFLNSCKVSIGNCASDPGCLKSAATVSIASLVAIAIFKSMSHYCFEHTVKKWATKRGNEVRLIRFRSDLHWSLRLANKKYTSPATNDIYTLETYIGGLRKADREILLLQSERVREVLKEKNGEFNKAQWLGEHVPLNKRISFFKENDLKDGEVNIFSDGRLTVELALRGFPSLYGAGVTITRDTWAVTILCRSDKCCSAGHSVIAYEGVIDGKPFVNYAHLVEDKKKPGYGLVLQIKNRVLDKESNIKQTGTWRRPNFKIAALVDRIERDIQEQKAGKRRYAFSLAGPIFHIPYIVYNVISRNKEAPLKLNCHLWATLTLLNADIDAVGESEMILSVPRFM